MFGSISVTPRGGANYKTADQDAGCADVTSEGGRDCWVVAAKRTAFGTFGAALRGTRATQLGAHAARAALAHAKVERAAVDQVIFGNVVQSCRNDAHCARHVGLVAANADPCLVHELRRRRARLGLGAACI